MQGEKSLFWIWGEPVKIVDLARNPDTSFQDINPDEDIQIVFTELRPGERNCMKRDAR